MNTERPLGAVLTLLGAGGIAMASQISVRTFNNDPGPKLFPIFACAILVICGLGLLLSRPQGSTRRIDGEALIRGLTMAALLIGYALGLWLLGFHLASLIAVFVLYWVIAGPARRVWWHGAIYAAAVTGAVHLLFAVALGAFLPRGILI